MADSVSAALEGSAEELRAWKEALLPSCVKWLLGTFSGPQQHGDSAPGQEERMLLRLNQLLVGVIPFLSCEPWLTV